MQIKPWKKIKELRKRDGRKQEGLANALGVTAQAVSRWEAGGYPDMSMIPAIANYFHITIDELFGYNNDRDAKKKGSVKKANRFLIDNDGDITECIRFMKKGLEEFSSEPELQMYLAHALGTKESQEAEKPNLYLEEAAALYEELSKQNSKAIIPLLSVYTMMGEYEKAEKKALEQPGIPMSKEVLLVSIFDEKKGSAIVEKRYWHCFMN
ncbi:MAG: helix-turn-helix transcriptional regulator [Acetatifactor sp.]